MGGIMKGHISAKVLCIAFCASMAAALFANYGFSQGGAASQQQIFLIYDIQVKPGMEQVFENVIKNDLIPGLKKLGDTGLFSWKTEFGQSGRYIMATPIKAMAELDAPDPLVGALGEKGIAYLMVRLNECAYSPRIFMVMGRSDLSMPTPQGYEPKLAIMFTATIAPGREGDFEKNSKAMQTIMGKTSVKGMLTAKMGPGGNMDEYLSFVLFDSFADMGRFQLAIQKIAMEGKLASPAGIVMSRKTSILSFAPEISFVPAARQAAN
jgi:hypothetical protein